MPVSQEGNLLRKATGYEQEKLKPRNPSSGSRAARAELPAPIGASVTHRFLRRGKIESGFYWEAFSFRSNVDLSNFLQTEPLTISWLADPSLACRNTGSWWLAVVSLALLIGVLVFSFGINVEGRNLTMNLPVALELNAPVHATSSSIQTDAQIENLRANLRVPVRNGAFFSGSMFLIVLLFGVLLLGLAQLRHIFRSLSRGLLSSVKSQIIVSAN